MQKLNLQNIDMEESPEKRLEICRKCPIYSTRFGGMCNNQLWMNVKTEDVSIEQKDGYIKGCGCILASKVKGVGGTCPAGKW